MRDIWYLPERLPAIPARDMRCLHFWMLCLTIVPGVPVAVLLRNSVAWVVLVSMVTWSATHLAGWSAERPSEIERDEEEQRERRKEEAKPRVGPG